MVEVERYIAALGVTWSKTLLELLNLSISASLSTKWILTASLRTQERVLFLRFLLLNLLEATGNSVFDSQHCVLLGSTEQIRQSTLLA